ncbi:MAG TPA: hypothetical protein VJL80_09895 [Aeromicrobium sp.]|nr:hypothetical protein [Aeromicrobium sp.]HKY58338.1 hypothetical protein [Aeromicrobium sp.]
MNIDVTINENTAEYVVRPTHGRPVTFVVEFRTAIISGARSVYRRSQSGNRYVVGLKGSTGAGFSTHTSFEAACRSALSRARKYAKAYSIPRGVAA